jgi:hypothetical protein
LQLWQIPCATWTSSEISSAQPESTRGRLEFPFWPIFLKQPFAVVQAGRPNCVLYFARSASAVGSSYASTMAIVCAFGAEVGSWYAVWNCCGDRPVGAVVASGEPFPSVTTSAVHSAVPAAGVEQTRCERPFPGAAAPVCAATSRSAAIVATGASQRRLLICTFPS